mgnify:CR=1 FL=1
MAKPFANEAWSCTSECSRLREYGFNDMLCFLCTLMLHQASFLVEYERVFSSISSAIYYDGIISAFSLSTLNTEFQMVVLSDPNPIKAWFRFILTIDIERFISRHL